MATRIGTPMADTLAGTAESDLILGLGGGDRLTGTGGGNVLLGGAGDDTIFGDAPGLPPRLPLDEGSLIVAGRGDDSVAAGLGADIVLGGGGNDTLHGGLFSSLTGFIEGGASANWQFDQGDLLRGGAGDDLLDGAGGEDTLLGGAGSDTLVGSADADQLWGGPGQDVFLFARSLGIYGGPDSGLGPGARDVIQDFRQGEDLIDLSRLASPVALPPGGPVEGSVFLGADPFTASFALQVRTEFQDGNTILQLVSARRSFDAAEQPTVPAGPEAEIELIGIHHLQACDVILT